MVVALSVTHSPHAPPLYPIPPFSVYRPWRWAACPPTSSPAATATSSPRPCSWKGSATAPAAPGGGPGAAAGTPRGAPPAPCRRTCASSPTSTARRPTARSVVMARPRYPTPLSLSLSRRYVLVCVGRFGPSPRPWCTSATRCAWFPPPSPPPCLPSSRHASVLFSHPTPPSYIPPAASPPSS
jgi:hypothetical protein